MPRGRPPVGGASVSFVLLGLALGCGGPPGSPGPSDAASAPDARGVASDGAAEGGAGAEPCNPLVPRTAPPEVWVGPEGLQGALVDFVEGSREELLLAVYELDAPALLRALGAAAERGVAVRIALDGRRPANATALETLPGRGVQVRSVTDPYPYYHLKVLVRDGREAVVGSANLNVYSMQTERNHLVRLGDRHDVEDLRELLLADLQGRAPGPALDCTRLLVSPARARERLEALLGSARERLDLQQLSLSDAGVRRVLSALRARGVEVRVLLADPTWIAGNDEAARWLRERGVQVRFFTRLENHAKLAVVDGRRAYVGSHNLSRTSIDRNREVGLVISAPEAVGRLAEAFEADWDASG